MPSERVQRRIDGLLDEVEEAVVRKDWDAVLLACDAVLRLDPENQDALAFIEAASRDTGIRAPDAVTQPVASAEPVNTSGSIQPTSFASGRYTVSRFLGEGGKKKVYLAHDNTLDRDVAFALIKTEGLDDTSRERVKREAQAMGRMGTHPCIMPIYDLGEEPDANGVAQPFMVQPLMGGGDVEGLIEDADGPLALEDAIRIATQTAQGLVFAHGKGIVHRDLKPGNVWMDEDGAAKIGDFGLAVATDRSRLTVEKMMVGTVNYMPPEQATGGDVTPKADLYSLGAMLYEMSTGRVPFMGDDDIAVISQHVNTPPVAPSWHNTLIPKTLDSLILRMMAKDPAERPVDADEVLVALNAVDLSAVEERDESGKGSLDAMAGGVFVGRHKEMDQLKAGFEEVLSGKGRMVTLVGEPGIGKTRTAQELATYAAMRGAEVLWGRSYESGGAPPYWPWVQAIRSHVAATDPQVLRNQLGSTGPVIAEIVSDLKEKLPDLPAPTPIEDPESARFRLFDSISTFLKNTASSTPLVLMLEDLHWSDKPSLMLLEFVARELANSRILIVGNYRDMELNRRHPLSVTLGDLSRERLFERVVLRGLQRHDVERFIEIAAGITPPPALVDTVHSQTEGNPLFVTETVRLLIQEGDITSGSSSKGGTTSWEIRIPEGVREVIGRRLDRLSERCNEVLTIAAVIGRQFRFDVLKMLIEDTTDGQLLDAMDEALSARIIEEIPDEVGFYQFTHAQMQETLIGELSHTRAVRMHANIAEALEQYYGGNAEEHAGELVGHFAEAETVLGTEKLVKYSKLAGMQALSAGAFGDALTYLELVIQDRDLKHTADPESLSALARVYAAMLRYRDAGKRLSEAFNLFKDQGQIARAIEIIGYPYPVTVLFEIPDTVENAYKLAEAETLAQARISIPWAFVQWTRGRYEDAKLALSHATQTGRVEHDDMLLLRSLAMMANVAGFSKDFALASESAREALQLTESVSDYASEMRARLWLSHSLAMGISFPQSLEEAEFFLARARKFRDTTWITRALHPAARAAVCLGKWERAKELSREWRELSSISLGPDYSDTVCGVATGDRELAASSIERLLTSDPSESEGINWMLVVATGIWGARETGLATEFIASGKATLRKLLKNERKRRSLVTGLALWADLDGSDDESAIRSAIDYLEGQSQFDSGLQSTDAYKAKFHLKLGEINEAVESYEKAVDLSRRIEATVPLAWTSTEYSELLLERNAPGDREKAIELQDEAIAIATELGMKPLLERVLAKREILKA